MVKRYSEVAKEADRLARDNPNWAWEECFKRAKEEYGVLGGQWNACK